MMEEIFMLAGHFILKSIRIRTDGKRVYHREIFYFLIIVEFMALQLVYMRTQTQIMAKLILQRLLQVVRS